MKLSEVIVTTMTKDIRHSGPTNDGLAYRTYFPTESSQAEAMLGGLPRR